MMLSMVFALLWLVIANLLGTFPSKDNHWRRAYILVAIGVPLLGWVTIENGPWIALMFLAAGMSVLRWPVLYLSRWVRSLFVKG